MAELSRKKRFQDLRDQLDQEAEQLADQPSSPVKLSRSSRLAPSVRTGDAASTDLETVQQTVAVMDELLGEVKQYNINKGDRVAEDTQINILRTLDEAGDIEMKRRAHLETMEPNLEAGGTTMNINAMDIEQVSRAASSNASLLNILPKNSEPVFEEEEDVVISLPKTAPKKQAEPKAAKDDGLELFDLNAEDYSQTGAQNLNTEPAKPARKKSRKAVKETEPKVADRYEEEDDDEDDGRHKSSSIGNVILIVLILALVCLIGYTIYLISKANFI